MATLLHRMHEARRHGRETARQLAYSRLRSVLEELMPSGSRVWVFGSVLKPGRFREDSDIDIAIETPLPGRSEFWLQGELELRLKRAVDVLMLDDTRLREKIEREGELWIL